MQTGFKIFNTTQYGGHGEAVNTYDCDSYIRGFDPLWPPQLNSKHMEISMCFFTIQTTGDTMYAKLIPLIATISLLCSCSPKIDNSSEKWVLFAKQNNDKLYYTKDKMSKTDNGIVKIWVKTVLGKQIVMDDKKVAYAKNMYMIDCKNKKYHMNIGYYFSESGDTLSKTTTEQTDVMPLLLDKSNKVYTFKAISTPVLEFSAITDSSPISKLLPVACTNGP